MTLLRTALHYAGATALLLAAARLVLLIDKRPWTVSIERRLGDLARAGEDMLCIESVIVVRRTVVARRRFDEFYVERTAPNGLFVARGNNDDAGFVAKVELAIEPLYQRAEARAARGERPDRIEAA